jgi:hypothetical protein
VAEKYVSINLSQPLDGFVPMFICQTMFLLYLTFPSSFYSRFAIKIEGGIEADKPRSDVHTQSFFYENRK